MRIIEIIEGTDQYNKTHELYWSKLTPQAQAEWRQRQAQLTTRINTIYTRLQSVMSPQDRARLTAITVSSPLHGDMKYARADYKQSAITIDLGSFWDLSDDCLAFTLGHEIGHMVYYSRMDKSPGFWTDKVTPAQSRKEELDADTYGAVLAYRLGYNARRAFDFFTREIQQEQVGAKSTYPSVAQRQAAQARAIQRTPVQPQEAAPTDMEPTAGSIPQGAAPSEPTAPAEPPLAVGAKEDMQHAMAGIQNLTRVLQQDPQIALQLFPGPTASTQLA